MNNTPNEAELQPETKDESKKDKRRTFEITDSVARGTYANALAAAHTSNDFILDFVFANPSGRNIVSRIVLTPERMKALHGTMADNIKKYEQKYGEITQRQIKGDA